ncbi:hypothetical protein BH11ARM1_BH11ARM1_16920 [soil metagenome]
MKFLISLVLSVLLLGVAMGQNYTAKPGETLLKLEVEGRGNIIIKLHSKQAPKTVEHILELVKAGFYNGQRFHRVERTPKPYLVQVGDPNSKSGDLSGAGATNGTLAYEDSGFKNEAGAVGLAHSVDNRDTGDGQFYMLLDRSSFLDNNYTVFGRVVDGMDVLRKIVKGDRLVSVTVVGG